MNYREVKHIEIKKLRQLGIKSWSPYKAQLSETNWNQLLQTLSNNRTYVDLLNNSSCFICETKTNEIIGMAFFVPSGEKRDVYESNWSAIRFVSVLPEYSGQGIGKQLTLMCLDEAKRRNEQVIALHTSEIMNAARHIYEKLGFKVMKELPERLGIKYWLYTLNING